MTFLADLRAHRRIRAERDAWRVRALSAERAADAHRWLTIGLRRRCDELEETNVRLASALERAELHISEEAK